MMILLVGNLLFSLNCTYHKYDVMQEIRNG